MPSMLDGRLAKQIYRSFKGKLLRGVLRRDVTSTVSAYGDPVAASSATYPFEGIRQDFSAFYKAQAGIPNTDVKIMILAASIKTDPRKDDLLQLQSRWYRVRNLLEVDPATASYLLQCFETTAPSS